MKTFIIAALTIDGFIGRNSEHSSLDWTSPEDKQHYRQATKEAGVMIMGPKTFDTIGRGLPGRRTIVITSRPADYGGIEGVEPTSEEPAAIISRLEAEGFEQVAVCGGSSVYHQFMQAGLVDELLLTVEPLVFGKGIPLFSDSIDFRLGLLAFRQLNPNSLLVHYKVTG